MGYKILDQDSYLRPYEKDIELRMTNYHNMRDRLAPDQMPLSQFANGHLFYGIHQLNDGWIYREWAPGADAMFFTGDFNGWNTESHPMTAIGNGNFEIFLPGVDALKEGEYIQTIIWHEGNMLRRIPAYATYVVQDPDSYQWTARIVTKEASYRWSDKNCELEEPLLIYECHIGMAQEKYGIGSYTEFKDKILPRIKALGYNTIQIMAIMEHPYYGSFGYQVTNFFAASSRFGTPRELKSLVNKAHKLGIRVLLDVVHSHAAKNTNEGLNYFDGTDYQYFDIGEKGYHRQWDTKLFNYGKPEVLHFLLSNLQFWMKEYHFDGFRFDGVTSMLYHDHGMGSAFDNYNKYFSMNTNTDAVTYLQLANELIHEINPQAITIAEDMSAMPGMCRPIPEGGIGFNYRLGMGVPPMWIDFLSERVDEDWDVWKMWYELSSRRPKEKVIGYVESHDQALVGDKTVMFRLCDQEMYWCMAKNVPSMIIDRGIALHKMIRFITETVSGEGYLNFMGNEFGHPEWVDFPREGNGWSYHYCRRQWSLADNPDLKYEWLQNFDVAMLAFTKEHHILEGAPHSLWLQQADKIIAYERNNMIFAFNFHPTKSFAGYCIPVNEKGDYKILLTTDEVAFGGQDRIDENMVYPSIDIGDGRFGVLLYLPSRTGIALQKTPAKSKKKKKKQ